MNGLLGFFRQRLQGGGGMPARWVPVAAIGLMCVLALLFVHIFVVIVLSVTAVLIGKSLVEWVLGPGTRIRLVRPWGRIPLPLWLSRLTKAGRQR